MHHGCVTEDDGVAAQGIGEGGNRVDTIVPLCKVSFHWGDFTAPFFVAFWEMQAAKTTKPIKFRRRRCRSQKQQNREITLYLGQGKL